MDTVTANRLHELLTRQMAAHEEMRNVLLEQQQALRRFDTAGLESLRQRCDVLAERIAELDQARQTITGPGIRLRELAQTLAEPARSRLVATSLGLRKIAEEIASINRINRAAVQNMLNHFHTVYQMLAGASQSPGYGATGRSTTAPVGAFLVDAVA